MGAISLSLRGSGESEYPQVTTLGGTREARDKAKGAIGAQSTGKSCIVKWNWAKVVGER
jgi:hypothetical protein